MLEMQSSNPLLKELSEVEFEEIVEVLGRPVVKKVLYSELRNLQAAVFGLNMDEVGFNSTFRAMQTSFLHINNLLQLPLHVEAEKERQG